VAVDRRAAQRPSNKRAVPPLSSFGGPSHINRETHPEAFLRAVDNVTAVGRATPPEMVEEGRVWYPKVHEAAQKATRGRNVSLEQNAGIIAAISPNMDFEAVNIGALEDVHRISPKGWSAIERSAMARGRRTPEASDALRGLGIANAADSGLHKAHRVLQGESLEEVFNPVTSPKTHAFAHNIIDPSGGSFQGLTIDGRAHDIARNQMLPWGTTRSIGGSAPGRRRYEDMEDVYRSARPALEEEHGVDLSGPAVQAATWVGGKHLERMSTKKGAAAKQGPSRKGQPYV
jgi:hypothetical protein